MCVKQADFPARLARERTSLLASAPLVDLAGGVRTEERRPTSDGLCPNLGDSADPGRRVCGGNRKNGLIDTPAI
jgi:hypothetical protein